jgi:putative component of membrane protein insertase Oxa1/YidC/SpoIIIJ protein YidD
MRRIVLITSVFIFFNIVADCFGSESDSSPWTFNRQNNHEDRGLSQRNRTMDGTLITRGLRIIFQAVSAVDGDRCPMAPTCSAYSLEAMEKHGVLMGSLMTIDRLIHEMNETDFAPLVRIGDEYRYKDRVKDNDFWWFSEERLDK